MLEESKAASEDLEAQLEAAKVKAKAAAEACAAAEARASHAEAAREAAEAARLAAERARRCCRAAPAHAMLHLLCTLQGQHNAPHTCYHLSVLHNSLVCTNSWAWWASGPCGHQEFASASKCQALSSSGGRAERPAQLQRLLQNGHWSCRDTEAEAQAAAAAAEVERSERAAAQGLSVQLKAEADRRAKVFHNAVKAGVAKVQAELEAERDSLEARYDYPAPFLHCTTGRLLHRPSSTRRPLARHTSTL